MPLWPCGPPATAAEHVVTRAHRSVPATTGRDTSIDLPSAAATKTELPLPETAAILRGGSLTARLRMEYPGLPSGLSTGSAEEDERLTTRSPRRPQSSPSAVPPASKSSPEVTEASTLPPRRGTGAPPTVMRTRSTPGTWRSVLASWSTARSSSFAVTCRISRESGTSATPLSVTTTERSRSVREGSADRVTSAKPKPGPASRPRTRLVAVCSPRGMNTGSGSNVRPVWSKK